jgi:hypothetical protein
MVKLRKEPANTKGLLVLREIQERELEKRENEERMSNSLASFEENLRREKE